MVPSFEHGGCDNKLDGPHNTTFTPSCTIKQFRMTQTKLADALGEYQSFVARLESGQRRLDVIEFIRLAEILGFDAPKLMAKVRKIAI